MTLYKVVHDRNNPYLTINTTIATDDRLSWKAKGIWFYAFSRKDDWQFYKADLIKRSKEGERSLRSGLKELEECGYLYRRPYYDENKKQLGGWEWIFFETPKTEEEIQKMFQKRTKRVSLETQSSAKPPCIISNDSSVSNEEENNPETPSAIVISSFFDDLKIPDHMKEKIFERLKEKVGPDVNEEHAKLLVRRVLAWDNRENDIQGVHTVLKYWEYWGDRYKPEEIKIRNISFLEESPFEDGMIIKNHTVYIGKRADGRYIEFICGQRVEEFNTSQKNFIRKLADYSNERLGIDIFELAEKHTLKNETSNFF